MVLGSPELSPNENSQHKEYLRNMFKYFVFVSDESKTRFITRRTMEGRAPLRVVGSKLLVVARGGNSLRLHDSSFDTGFKLLHEIKVCHIIFRSTKCFSHNVVLLAPEGATCVREDCRDVKGCSNSLNAGTERPVITVNLGRDLCL